VSSHLISLIYETQIVSLRIGSESLHIECLESLDRTIDQLFELLSKRGEPNLLEELCPYFGVIWPSARALADQLMERHATALRSSSTRVLEVGCGLALPSLVAAKMGAQVTSTDYHPEVPRFLKRNLELNVVSGLRFLALDWRMKGLEHEKFDLVIGSDVLYERHHPPILAKAMTEHLAEGGTIVLTDPGRPYLQGFVEEMARLGFGHETSVKTAPDQTHSLTKEIFVLTFCRA
jgi:predicted nicotinamide N-methyase